MYNACDVTDQMAVQKEFELIQDVLGIRHTTLKQPLFKIFLMLDNHCTECTL